MKTNHGNLGAILSLNAESSFLKIEQNSIFAHLRSCTSFENYSWSGDDEISSLRFESVGDPDLPT